MLTVMHMNDGGWNVIVLPIAKLLLAGYNSFSFIDSTNKGGFRFYPIGAFVYIFALGQSDCVNFQLLPENTNILTEL